MTGARDAAVREVLQIVASTDPRGAEVFALSLASALEPTVRVTTLALAPGASGGLPVETLGSTRLGVATLAALRRRMGAADAVVAHGSTTLPACAVAGVGLGRPIVYRNIGDPLQWSNTRARRLRTRLLLARMQRIVALTSGTADVLSTTLGVRPDRVRIVPNGVDGTRFVPAGPGERRAARDALGLADTATVALYVGALSPEKNVDVAIAAVAARPDLTLLIVGDGLERDRLERLADADAPGRVRFLGRTEDPGPQYHAADVVVLPSRTEGMPAVLIEAGLCELPVVASDVGFVREIVVPDRTGVLVAAGDAGALAGGIDRALADREQLGAHAGRRCRERFTLERVAAEWMGVLDDLWR